MFGDWVLVLLMTVPAVAIGYWRYCRAKRRGYKRKAGVILGVMFVMVCLGAYKRQQALDALHQEDPQALRYHPNPFVRGLFTPSAAPTTVTDDATAQEVFTYYRNDGAARLTALARPSSKEWLATLSVNDGESRNAKLNGWWEEPVKDDARILPMTRLFCAWNGRLRVEDVQTGQTLFSYIEDGSLRPVSVARQVNGAGLSEWQVLFTAGAGLVSQQAAPAQP